MRAVLIAAVIAVASTFTLAGPSDHASRRPGDAGRAQRPEVRKHDRRARPPFALSGERAPRRVLEYRDVPRGRGQSESMPFWTWVND